MNVQTFASKPSFAINSAHICAGIVMASLILFVHIETLCRWCMCLVLETSFGKNAYSLSLHEYDKIKAS